MRSVASAWVICAVVALGGCLYIPTSKHGSLGARDTISDALSASIRPYESSRVDVLLAFGEPEFVGHEQQLFVYNWAIASGYLFAFTQFAVVPIQIPDNHVLVVEFNESGMVRRCEAIEIPVNMSRGEFAEQLSRGMADSSVEN